MAGFRPKYITFDCYGTLTNFRVGPTAAEAMGERLPAAIREPFLKDFAAYRLDEVLGAWKPYVDVLKNALERTCRKYGLPFIEAEGQAVYDAVPSWGPHADVPEPLTKVGNAYPLVVLSNASNDQIHSNVKLLQAPFHAVYTAQMAQAYKPRMQAFEYMLDQLNCDPKDILHVSSSYRYDLMTAYDMGFGMRAHVARGHEPTNPFYGAQPIPDISGLPGLVGL